MASPAGETLGLDLRCISCGYNLRGLTAEGVCPECAHPIARSITARSLCGPAELRRAVRSAQIMLVAIAISIVSGALPQGRPIVPIGMSLSLAVECIAWATTFAALVLALRAWPAGRVQRRIERTLLVFVCLPAIAAIIPRDWMSADVFVIKSVVIAIPAVCASAALTFSYYSRFARIAHAMGNRTFAGEAWITTWAVLSSFILPSLCDTASLLGLGGWTTLIPPGMRPVTAPHSSVIRMVMHIYDQGILILLVRIYELLPLLVAMVLGTYVLIRSRNVFNPAGSSAH